MALRLGLLNSKARDDAALGRFWADALGWDVFSDGAAVTGVGPVGFVWPDPVGFCVHLDLASTSAAHQAEPAARLKKLGATPADVGQGDVSWVVLADPEGNEFCVLAPA